MLIACTSTTICRIYFLYAYILIIRLIYAGCSANSDAETSRSALAAGMSVFIPKPLTIKSFQIAYHNLLSSSPLIAANNPIPTPSAYVTALSGKGIATLTPTTGTGTAVIGSKGISSKGIATITPNTAAAVPAMSRKGIGNVPPRPSGSSSQRLGGGSIRQASRVSSTT